MIAALHYAVVVLVFAGAAAIAIGAIAITVMPRRRRIADLLAQAVMIR